MVQTLYNTSAGWLAAYFAVEFGRCRMLRARQCRRGPVSYQNAAQLKEQLRALAQQQSPNG